MDGWMDGWMAGWMDGWEDVEARVLGGEKIDVPRRSCTDMSSGATCVWAAWNAWLVSRFRSEERSGTSQANKGR
jgi:hypothetical protein